MQLTDIYGLHPSEELRLLFAVHPYQGQSPDRAKLIVLGNDANYSSEISDHSFFQRILEYHRDGVAFWKSNEDGVHHPFLLKSYPLDKTRGGVPYHRNFSKLGLTKAHAEHISFVELLHVPTTGSSSTDMKKYKSMLDRDYICSLEEILLGGSKKLVLFNGGLLKNIDYLSKNIRCFQSFSTALKGYPVGTCISINQNCVCYIGYHFSASQIHGDINSMRQAIQMHCGF